jgi:hypothetical protein
VKAWGAILLLLAQLSAVSASETLPFGLREAQLDDVSIEYARYGGGWILDLDNRGSIEWHGKNLTVGGGRRIDHHVEIPRARLIEFLRLLEIERFFALRRRYSKPHVEDGGSSELTIRIGRRTKIVEATDGGPPAYEVIVSALHVIAEHPLDELTVRHTTRREGSTPSSTSSKREECGISGRGNRAPSPLR